MDTTDFQVDEFERRISAMCKGVKFADKIPDYRNAYILFITENQENKIGFAIRSTQEYFSAMMNVHNISDEKVINNIKKISESIYWRNVFMFMSINP